MVLVLFFVFPTWTVTYGSLEPVLSFACKPWAHNTRKRKKRAKLVRVCLCVWMQTDASTYLIIDTNTWHVSSPSTLILKVLASFNQNYLRGCDSVLTCDADLCWPLRGAIEHALLDLFHVCDVSWLHHSEHFLNQFKDLRLIPLTDLHAVFKNHNDVLGSVLCPMFGALLCCSCLAEERKELYTVCM